MQMQMLDPSAHRRFIDDFNIFPILRTRPHAVSDVEVDYRYLGSQDEVPRQEARSKGSPSHHAKGGSPTFPACNQLIRYPPTPIRTCYGHPNLSSPHRDRTNALLVGFRKTAGWIPAMPRHSCDLVIEDYGIATHQAWNWNKQASSSWPLVHDHTASMSLGFSQTDARTKVLGLRANSLTNPLGIAAGAPRLTWKLYSGRRATTHTHYEIHVASTANKIAQPSLHTDRHTGPRRADGLDR
jgi:hypothetical protein